MSTWYEQAIFYHMYPLGITGAPKTNVQTEVTDRFKELDQWIPHIRSLGCNAIYIGPLFESSSHGYDTRDYKLVDRRLGTNDDFREFTKLCHENGIKVVVDGVFNHTGREFFAFKDIQEKKWDSPYKDWYKGVNFGWQSPLGDPFGYEAWQGHFELPCLNLYNQQVKDYLFDVIRFWMDEFDIDGIRFDVGNEVSHRFLKRIREHVKAMKPDIYLLGEIWHDASQWLMGDEYDSVMNYPLMSGIHDFFIDRTMKKEDFEYMVNHCYTMYMQQSNNVLFNLLDSHDTERLMNRFRDLDIFYQQLAVLFTMPGSPCIYYGTEIAMEGSFDPDCRRCMPWDNLHTEENQRRIHEIQKLIHLRKTEPSFKSLYFHFPEEYRDDRLVHYIKLDRNQNQIEILLNCAQEDVTLQEKGEILFQRQYKNGRLYPKGVLIRRR